ncbi:hypothetical protein CR513_35047, partial [Mucuna pruriens]
MITSPKQSKSSKTNAKHFKTNTFHVEKKNGARRKNYSKNVSKDNKDKTQVMCCEWKKLGYFKLECPSLEKEKEKKRKTIFKKKKSLMATWEDLD